MPYTDELLAPPYSLMSNNNQSNRHGRSVLIPSEPAFGILTGLTLTVNAPVGKASARNLPFVFATAVRVSPVAVLVRTKLALGTAAPAGSNSDYSSTV